MFGLCTKRDTATVGAVISTFGATCCYLLSRSMGKGIAKALWPAKVEAFGKEIDKRRGDMFNYIVFLRLTPILPNTFINVASPVVRVPIWPFIIGQLPGHDKWHCQSELFKQIKT